MQASDTDALPEFSASEAFAFYERIRERLPAARFRNASRHAERLLDIADLHDAFVFDAFGVLNVGETPIAGARECIAALRARSKRVFVLTNAASYPFAAAVAKFRRLGFDFSPDEIVSSRMAAEAAAERSGTGTWGVAAPPGFDREELALRSAALGDDADAYARVDGFLLLSTAAWTFGRQALLESAMAARPRPVIVANPDVVAPREDGLSTEPGWCGHRLADIAPDLVTFHGKPFASVYDMIRERCTGIAAGRVAVVGDTLHTDILGGAAQGFGTVLVTDHGLPKSMDIAAAIRSSGIVPDWIVPSI